MPDAIITSTASTFGTISGTFAADQSTITGTVSGIVPGTLSGSVGVPGPAGSPGAPGPGVPAGGTAGQFLQKIDGTNYNTDWVTLNLSGYALLSGASFSGFCDFINGLSSSGPVTLLDNGYLDASGLDGDSRRRIRFGAGNGGGFWGLGDFGFDGSNLLFGNNENLPETLATRSWVTAGYAPLASPVFTGNPTAPTPATSDNDTSIATTAFVKAQGYLTSAPVTSVAGRTGAITLSNTDISGLGSLAVVNDAPSNGSQYARKNAAWDVVISGDRYLTSSTTSNTVSNGNKTFTIGTGLSYTPTQNITISYDASNHMHGEVLTYNSGTGVLTVDINHHTGSGTYAAWVVNVGGVTPATSVAWGAITGTISAQTDLQGQLDLKANLASPTFSGTPSLPTGTTAITQTAGNNTTAVATTAFVTAAVPAFAAATNVINDPTSTTLALNPSNIPFLLANGNYRNYCSLTTNAISGSAGVTQFGPARELYTTSTSVAGRATWFSSSYAGDFVNISSPSNARVINWSKRVWIFGVAILGRGSYLGNANTICRVNLGGRTSSATGNLTTKGIGFFKVGGTSTFVNLTVHNGTTLTNVATSVTVASDASVHYIIYSDGAGNVQLYLNGTLAASTTAGPTGDSTAGANIYEEQLESATSNGALSSMHVAGAGVYIQR
jgi:hypothetical protein